VIKAFPALNPNEDIIVIVQKGIVSKDAKEIGEAKVGYNGLENDCDWYEALAIAKEEARKIGGNAIKITEHQISGSYLIQRHRIIAKIFIINNLHDQQFGIVNSHDSSFVDRNYALLHVYRQGDFAVFLDYKLHLGDSVICNVKNNQKKTIKIYTFGTHTIWARTESKEELKINFEKGKEYYIKCGVAQGLLIGRPDLEIVKNHIGKAEYNSIQSYDNGNLDKIIMDDGREILCTITNEDDDNVYIIIIKGDNELNTLVNKNKIKSIVKG